MHITSLATRIVAPIAGLALIWVLYLLGGYFRHQVSRARSPWAAALWDLLSNVDEVALHVVESLEQTVVNPAKASGVWNAQLAADTKSKAVKDVKAILAGSGADWPGAPVLDTIIEHSVETLVRRIGSQPAGSGSMRATLPKAPGHSMQTEATMPGPGYRGP